MEAYYSNDKGKLYNCNCLDLMKEMGDGTVDCIATDPPYGYSFMGKDWDRAVPGVEIWKEALRILKDGAFAFVMSAPRQDVLMHNYSNLQQAGFDTAFTSIFWCYASGFPKALNIGKAIDRKQGCDPTIIREYKADPNKFPEGSIRREEIKDNYKISYETAPSSPEAKLMDGSYAGFQPKPALEVIIVAMKPLSEKTYVEQALKNGKGVTWLDNCRIPVSDSDETIAKNPHTRSKGTEEYDVNCYGKYEAPDYDYDPKKGRFPANLLVSDNALDTGRVSKATPHGGDGGKLDTREMGWGFKRLPCDIQDEGDFSRYFDVDRWFDERVKELPDSIRKTYPFLIVPKPSKSEKNLGCEHIEKENIGHNRFDKCSVCGGYILQNPDRPSKCKCETPTRENNTVKGNHHPTVKSITLMSYLITLGSRKGDLVYDPFVGSGTTAIASELMERMWIASELDTKSCEIAKARLSAVPQYAELPTLTEVKKMRTRLTQKNLFDYS
jgi:site-specific DNA-methyltransferase (adenine-specific)